MNVFRYLILPFTICFLLSSCEEDFASLNPTEEINENNSKSYPRVDPELWVYFENFEKAAALHGLEVDLVDEGIYGAIENIDEANVAGSCSYGGFSPGRVVLDTDFWDLSNNSTKELIVFHELGHCFLFRDHLEGSLDNGNCKSIMRSGLERCRDAYYGENMEYYQDELFSVDNRKN